MPWPLYPFYIVLPNLPCLANPWDFGARKWDLLSTKIKDMAVKSLGVPRALPKLNSFRSKWGCLPMGDPQVRWIKWKFHGKSQQKWGWFWARPILGNLHVHPFIRFLPPIRVITPNDNSGLVLKVLGYVGFIHVQCPFQGWMCFIPAFHFSRLGVRAKNRENPNLQSVKH